MHLRAFPPSAAAIAVGLCFGSSTAHAEELDCPPGAFCEETTPEPDEDDTPPADPPDEPMVEVAPGDDETGELDAPPADAAVEAAVINASVETAETRPTPADSVKEEPTSPVVEAGAGIFVTSYAVPFVIGAVALFVSDTIPEAESLAPLMLPVAGPLITGAIEDASPAVWGILGANTGVQALGLLVIAVGLSMEPDALASSTVVPTANGFLVRF